MAKSTKQNRKLTVQFVEYMVSGGVYFWVGYLLLDYLYYVLHWSLWWATILSNIAGWSVNYLWYRFWVFPEKLAKKKKVVTPARVVAHRAHGHMAYTRR
jgi:putative flippase GtrA